MTKEKISIDPELPRRLLARLAALTGLGVDCADVTWQGANFRLVEARLGEVAVAEIDGRVTADAVALELGPLLPPPLAGIRMELRLALRAGDIDEAGPMRLHLARDDATPPFSLTLEATANGVLAAACRIGALDATMTLRHPRTPPLALSWRLAEAALAGLLTGGGFGIEDWRRLLAALEEE